MIRRIVLAAVPEGMVKDSDFRLEEVREPSCPPGGLLIRTRYLSVDPYIRGRMTGNKSYIDPIPVNEPMVSGAVGEVIESQADGFSRGDLLAGLWAWQEIVALPAKAVQKLPPEVSPPSLALGILGMPGATAYFGLTELCAPMPGQTVVVSGAAGAVGSAAGQIAKILGARVVGTVGSDEKASYIRSIGFDGVLNYRTDRPYIEELRDICPDGIDCYFDNVGGEVTDAVFELLNVRARVAVCGQISQYNDRGRDIGPRPFWNMIVRQIRAEGFLVSRWADRFPEAQRQMAEWLGHGRLQFRETVYSGLENTPAAFIGLFTGENIGKAIVRL